MLIGLQGEGCKAMTIAKSGLAPRHHDWSMAKTLHKRGQRIARSRRFFTFLGLPKSAPLTYFLSSASPEPS